jgi:pimeloyl-ACP methyl ester carboxylesterase
MLFIDGVKLEYRLAGESVPDGPTLVFLHEGLGSQGLWRDFPDRVAAATGLPALVYSRRGYGQSDRAHLPRPASYLHDEALVTLPKVLRALHIRRPILVGHSDGASIALIFAASPEGAGTLGVVAMAPHVLVEEETLAGIRRAVDQWAMGDLGHRLARHHRDVDGAFTGWAGTWLRPDFRDWDITGLLPNITVPTLVIQGDNDEYATNRQYDLIRDGVSGPVEVLVPKNCGHSPWREKPDETLAVVAAFVTRLMG